MAGETIPAEAGNRFIKYIVSDYIHEHQLFFLRAGKDKDEFSFSYKPERPSDGGMFSIK
jgi:hypothetical protein